MRNHTGLFILSRFFNIKLLNIKNKKEQIKE